MQVRSGGPGGNERSSRVFSGRPPLFGRPACSFIAAAASILFWAYKTFSRKLSESGKVAPAERSTMSWQNRGAVRVGPDFLQVIKKIGSGASGDHMTLDAILLVKRGAMFGLAGVDRAENL